MPAVERVCAFSSGESTANGRLVNPCTAALCTCELPVTRYLLWVYYICTKEDSLALLPLLEVGHGSPTVHCLISANKQHEAVPEVMRHPDVKNFSDYDFGDLSQSIPHISKDTFFLHDSCPCCYQVNLPPAPPPPQLLNDYGEVS